ncbi:MAG: hypothetical protein QNJ37_16050 [Crocosphaera sp.]|nr:hypothetical protein [Crocosphaera sp.]
MFSRKLKPSFNTLIPFLCLLPLGYLFIVLYLFSAQSWQKALSAFGIIGAVASASLVIGFLLGFLFGIPKIIKVNKSLSELDKPASALPIENNTNLEEISDWLTKILVGVGLTQLQGILKFIKLNIVDNIAPGFDLSYHGTETNSHASPIAISITIGNLIYFFVSGFIIGYLWTVLIYSEALKGSLQKIQERLKISVQIQLTRQIIDVIPSIDYLYPDFGYSEPKNKTQNRLNEIKKTIDKILNILRKEEEDIPNNSDSFLNEILDNLNTQKYDFLRSIDYVKLGGLLIMARDIESYQNAMKLFDKAIEINIFSNIACNLKGLMYIKLSEELKSPKIKLKNLDEAINLFTKSIEIDKGDFKAWRYKGGAFIMYINYLGSDIEKEKKVDLANEALEASERAIKLNSNEVGAYINKAYALSLLGKPKKEQFEAYIKSLEIDPEASLAHYNLACFYALQNDFLKEESNFYTWVMCKGIYLFVLSLFWVIMLQKCCALDSLEKAIYYNEDIKELAQQDKDFESLRKDEETKYIFENLIK